jgi:uncharacterized protein
MATDKAETDSRLVQRLAAALRQNRSLWQILCRFDEIALPDAWLVAGAVAQTVWNLSLGRPAEHGIKDVDLVYFDATDFSLEAEVAQEQRLRRQFKTLPVQLDVKNEARVHLWYHRTFGYSIPPYSSTKAAIDTFPTTATSIGVCWRASRFECYAPFGLDDLFSLAVRPNKAQVTVAIYEAKLARWRNQWPELTYLDWDAPTVL